MEYLHTMVRVSDLDDALKFYVDALGLSEVRRKEVPQGRFTLVFLTDPVNAAKLEADPAYNAPMIEITYNWDPEDFQGGRNFGHLAYRVDNIYETCQRLQDAGVTINRPPRDGYMAFVRSPDNISIELLQKGERLEPQEPWASMENSGEW